MNKDMNRFSSFLGAPEVLPRAPVRPDLPNIRKTMAAMVFPQSFGSSGNMFDSLQFMESSSDQKFHVSNKQMETSVLPGRQTDTIAGSIRLDLNNMKNAPKRSSFMPEMFESPSRQLPGFKEKKVYAYAGATVENVTAVQRPTVKSYCTGSRYIGEFNQIGFCGKGIYRYPHGVIYDGHFNRRGEQHGTGLLIYPNGQRIEGIWRNGKMIKGGASFVSKDNATLDSQYCKMPDRRFQIEFRNDIQPAGQEYLTNDDAPKKIPPDSYDTGNGFYCPKTKTMTEYNREESHEDLSDSERFCNDNDSLYRAITLPTPSQEELMQTLRSPDDTTHTNQIVGTMSTDEKEEWIINNCRKAWDEAVGYRPEFYEAWTPGYKQDHFPTTIIINQLLARTSLEDKVISRLSKLLPTQQIGQVASKDDSNTLSLYSFIQKPSPDRKQVDTTSLGSVVQNTWSTMFMPLGTVGLYPEKRSVFHHQKPPTRRSDDPGSYKGKSVQIAPSAIRRKTKKSFKHLVALAKLAREMKKNSSEN